MKDKWIISESDINKEIIYNNKYIPYFDKINNNILLIKLIKIFMQ